MIFTPKIFPETLLTVRETPSKATEPFSEIKSFKSSGTSNSNLLLSPSTFVEVIFATPSTCPDTIWPPSSSPSFNALSVLILVPTPHSPMVVRSNVSADASTANQFSPFSMTNSLDLDPSFQTGLKMSATFKVLRTAILFPTSSASDPEIGLSRMYQTFNYQLMVPV